MTYFITVFKSHFLENIDNYFIFRISLEKNMNQIVFESNLISVNCKLNINLSMVGVYGARMQSEILHLKLLKLQQIKCQRPR